VKSWIVLKFGGTSVTGLENWKRIAGVLSTCLSEGSRPLVVCSALSSVSDGLERLAAKASSGEDFSAELDGLCRRHRDAASELGLDADAEIGDLLADLGRLSQGASLIQEVSPRLWARLLSAGELLSTRLGAAWLRKQGLPVKWMDARALLLASGTDSYLSASCSFQSDPHLQERLCREEAEILVTQGFIARNGSGDTVLLGRGGSDTSAAYFAAKLGAERLEIWTDVPGMFTANPKEVPTARLLHRLDYEEAQEMATTGAKALHPRCIAPVRAHGIPLHIRCTGAPELPGTRIASEASSRAGLKGISVRKGLWLVSMDTVGMWQRAGFLADAFAVFKRHGLSVDLLATSETNVTASLDPLANDLGRLEELASDLRDLCEPRLIGPAASVSLVGRRIRSILPQLAPVFERFSDQTVHLLTQAASDLNLTFVVEESQADSLLRGLHARLFSDLPGDPALGPTWGELFSPPSPPVQQWWVAERGRLLAEAQRGTPVYVYSEEVLRKRASELLSLASVDRVYYAVKANPAPRIVELFAGMGLGFECVSPGELHHVREVAGDGVPLLFTPNFAPRAEYEAGFEAGAAVTLDSLHPLLRWPEIFSGREIILRIDPGHGRGHHSHVVTAGSQSKFGLPLSEIGQVKELAALHGVRVTGLHAHAGSGIRDPGNWLEKALFLAELAKGFPDVRSLNLGGGFGIPEKEGQARLDLAGLDSSLSAFRRANPGLGIWVEPGRYLVAEAGVLLASVTQLKSKGERRYVGTDAGMNSLIRPALYGAWHEISPLSRLGSPAEIVADVVGPICESGDVIGRARPLPATEEGDVLLVATAGAYGRSMSSSYNLRPPAREAWLGSENDGGS
jgi:bifunctional diaminopimelate decarboxylase / aspartate kinase